MTTKVCVVCSSEDVNKARTIRSALKDCDVEIIEPSVETVIGLLDSEAAKLAFNGVEYVIILYTRNHNSPTFSFSRFEAAFYAAGLPSENFLHVLMEDIQEIPNEVKTKIFANFATDPESAGKKLRERFCKSSKTEKRQIIHVFTSVKGGVGKTLLALSCLFAYSYAKDPTLANRKLVAVDMNHMNTDLHAILFPYTYKPKGKTIASGSWQPLDLKMRHAYRGKYKLASMTTGRFELPSGSKEFWKKLNELSESNPDADMIVDTNLSLANLLSGFSTDDERQTLVWKSNRIVYFWVFWTYSAIVSAYEAINQTVAEDHDQTFYTMERVLPPQHESIVKLVHVINPSAMVALYPDKALIESLVDDAQKGIEANEKLRGMAKEFAHQSSNSSPVREWQKILIEQTDDVMRAVEKSESVYRYLLDAFIGLHSKEREYEGLIDLMGLPVSSQYGYKEFVATVRDFINDNGSNPDDLFASNFKDFPKRFNYHRPSNILPITTYQPSLRGYTDRIAIQRPKDIAKLRDKLKRIERDLGKFLEELVLSAD